VSIMSSICPALYRDESGNFMCKYADRQVDPIYMPCMSDYTTCPVYIDYMRRKEEEKKEKPIEKREEEIVPTTVEVAVPEAVPQVPMEEEITPPPEAKEQSLLDESYEIEDRINELNEYWSNYEEMVNKLTDKWSVLKDKMIVYLSGIDKALQSLIEEREELNAYYELGIIDEAKYSEKIKEMDERIAEYEKERNDIAALLEKIDSLIEPHLRRIKAATAKPDIGKLKISLMRLEELYRNREIDESTYQKIRAELVAQIKKLEKIAEV